MPLRHWARSAALLGLAAVTGVLTCSVADAGSDAPEWISLSALGTAAFLLLLALALASLRRLPLRAALGLGRSALPGTTLLALLAGTLCLSQMLDAILELTGASQGSVIQELEGFLAGARGQPLVIAVVCIGLAPGVGEELFFRGFLQRALWARFGGAGAVLAAALLFGAAHGHPTHAASAAVLGLYLGAVAWLAASTRAAMACHIANNVAAVLTSAWELEWSAAMELPVALASGAGAALALHYAFRRAAASLQPATRSTDSETG